MKAYFISDLHIGANGDSEEAHQHQLLFKLLKQVESDGTHLYIVGDLFDFWFEYSYVVPKRYFNFLYQLRKLTEQGIEVYYLAGNHDFALGNYFDKYLQIKTYQDEYETELNGKKFYLFHGDGIAKKDVGYRILKRILRSRINQKIFRWIHPDIGIKLAKLVSGGSRKYTNTINEMRDEGDYIEYAEQQFERGFDYVLMGHRHNPLVHEKGNCKYINLGDWIEKFTYVEFNGTDLELKYFNEETP